MALDKDTNFEVRTTGNDGNGGGFVVGSGGTDFSQQNAAQYSFSDLASSNGTSSTPSVTSAGHSFVASDVGNIMQITAGTNFTPGFYQILSVGAGAATLDRAIGSAASLSGGSYAVGGALLTIQQAYNAAAQVSAGSNNSVGGKIWLKVGTYALTTPVATGQQQYTALIGYDAAHGDDTGNRPLVTTATNSTQLFNCNGTPTTTYYFDNINFSNTAGTPEVGMYLSAASNNARIQVRRAVFNGFTNAINGDNAGIHFVWQYVALAFVEIKNCTSHALALNATNYMLDSCYIHNNTGNSVSGGNSTIIVDTIIDSNGGTCTVAGDHCIIKNSVFSNTGGAGNGATLNTGTNEVSWFISNSVFYGNGGNGIALGAPGRAYIYGYNNAFGANTGGALSAGVNLLLGSITLTANPFTSGTDFTPNATAGGGPLLTNAGKPVVGGLHNPNVGAIQVTGGAGASGLLGRAVMSGGMYG